MATIFNLFGDAVWAQLERPVPQTATLPKALTGKIGLSAEEPVKNCCIDCELKGLCDESECAQHLFPLDSPYEGTRFPNLGEYINFLKHYGWV